MQTLIQADQTWTIWTILLFSAALGLWVERTRFGARTSGAIVTLICSFLLSNFGIIPASAPAYDIVWTFLVPLAIPLLLFHASLLRIVRESGATLIAFAIGAIGTVVGTFIAFFLVPLGDESWQLAAVFSSNYIGDSINYMATAETVGLDSSNLLTAGLAVNSMMMVLYLLILFSLPSLHRLRLYFNEVPRTDRYGSTTQVVINESTHGTRINIPVLATALALSMLICSISYLLENKLSLAGSAILILTVITVTLATLLPKAMEKLEGSSELGMLIMQILFAVIGASAHVATVLKNGPLLFVFALIILLIHLLFIVIGGWYFKLSLPEIVIAANANLGNPSTAAAMAASRRWDHLVVPAILCGTLGYAIATFIGSNIGNLLQ